MVYLEGVQNVFCNTIVFPVSLVQTNYLVVGAILLKSLSHATFFNPENSLHGFPVMMSHQKKRGIFCVHGMDNLNYDKKESRTRRGGRRCLERY